MKIGILTQTLHNNYGGLLQNYALQQILIRCGHTPCTIDHTRTEEVKRLRRELSRVKAHICHLAFPTRYRRPDYVANKHEEAIISQNTNYFIDKYIRRTRTLSSHNDFLNIARDYKFQAYVVGSDQCWRPEYNRSFLKEMFLCFAEKQSDVNRVTYAASFGKDKWDLPLETKKECARLAKLFDLVTVREESGVSLCKEHLGVEAQNVLDPTMLLAKEDYIKLVEQEGELHSSGDLFYYILDPSQEKAKFVMDAANSMGLVPFTVMPKYPRGYRSKKNIKDSINDCIYPSVTSWLRAFMDAKMTMVDSFHGMVFSIIFNKPFWVIGNAERGMSRFTSLLKNFGLEDRLINLEHPVSIELKQTINWDSVNRQKEILAEKSMSLLIESLTN